MRKAVGYQESKALLSLHKAFQRDINELTPKDDDDDDNDDHEDDNDAQ